jgi:hypothetical protein
MMKIWWNLYIWFLNKFMMQIGRFHPFYRPLRPLGRIEEKLTLFLDLGTGRG